MENKYRIVGNGVKYRVEKNKPIRDFRGRLCDKWEVIRAQGLLIAFQDCNFEFDVLDHARAARDEAIKQDKVEARKTEWKVVE